MTGRPASGGTYYTLLRHYNRSNTSTTRDNRVECICGKTLFKSQMKLHLVSGIHQRLMKYKEMLEAEQNLLEVSSDMIKPDKIVQRLVQDLDFRRQIQSVLELLV